MKTDLPAWIPNPDGADLAGRIDHTLLKPEATREQIRRLCGEALEHGFRSVCIQPVYVAEARRLLDGSRSRVCTVVGFPLGADAPGIKAAAAREAIEDGAQDIDMVLFIGGLKGGELERVRDDIRSVVDVCRPSHALCKVILETCLLTDREKRAACGLCVEAGAQFVKTATGFSSGGSTEPDLALMRDCVAFHGLGIKASGGVRTRADAMRMFAAGATIIGASSSVQIIRGC